MSSIALFSLIALVVGALLVILGLVAWQEARRRPAYDPLQYVVEDAVKHVTERLPADTELRSADVRRILEWEVFYLQGLAQDDRSNPVETVAGGHEASVDYISEQIRVKHGVSYPRAEIEDVLRLEADYLVAIGAVGDPVAFGEEE